MSIYPVDVLRHIVLGYILSQKRSPKFFLLRVSNPTRCWVNVCQFNKKVVEPVSDPDKDVGSSVRGDRVVAAKNDIVAYCVKTWRWWLRDGWLGSLRADLPSRRHNVPFAHT